MIDKIISFLVSAVAAVIVMLLHELPKAYTYYKRNKKTGEEKIFQYKLSAFIDPVGLLLFIAFYAGFSKPYMYGSKDRKNNIYIGCAGFASLLLQFLVAFLISKLLFPNENVVYINDIVTTTISYFLYFIMLFSFTMFLVNLLPISTFDGAFILSTLSKKQYYYTVKYDVIWKVVLLIGIVLCVPATLGQLLLNWLLF